MKIKFALLLPLLLVACGETGSATDDAWDDSAGKFADAGRVACAVEGASSFASVCPMERLSAPEGTTLTIRHPNGAFRRLLVTTDGRGVVAADGADPAVVSILANNRIEVSVAGDRYQLPATVKASR